MGKIKVLEFKMEMLDECGDLFMDVFSKEPWYDSRDAVIDFFRNHYKNNYFLSYVAIMNEKIVGASIGFIKPWIAGMEYYIDEFFVEYNGQRSGIGTEFMRIIEEDLKKRNINGIIISTERDFPSHKFYLKNEFSVIEDSITLIKEI